MMYRVNYEVRNRGAQGIFWMAAFTVKADSPAEATRKAMEQAHKEGYETRFPYSVQEEPT